MSWQQRSFRKVALLNRILRGKIHQKPYILQKAETLRGSAFFLKPFTLEYSEKILSCNISLWKKFQKLIVWNKQRYGYKAPVYAQGMLTFCLFFRYFKALFVFMLFTWLTKWQGNPPHYCLGIIALSLDYSNKMK